MYSIWYAMSCAILQPYQEGRCIEDQVPRFTAYCRHSMLKGEINPKVVKEILGHSDVRTTLDIYRHVLPSIHKKTSQKFGNMLFDQANIAL